MRNFLRLAIPMGAAILGATAMGETAPPTMAVRLAEWLDSRPHAPADSGTAVAIDAATASAFDIALNAALDGDYQGAAAAAAPIGYELLHLTDGGKSYVALIEQGGRGVHPTVVLSTAPARDVVVEAPHSANERGTPREAAAFLTRLGVRAAILEGAHRCASSKASGCDGSTHICGSSAPYRDSDVAHARSSLFQTAHEVLAARYPQATFVQIHRMRDDATAVIASDSSSQVRSNDTSLATRLRARIRAQGVSDRFAVSCQAKEDQGMGWPDLCGTNNYQARHLAGSADACTIEAPDPSGRFLHVEQGSAVLDVEEPGKRVVDALVAELPCFGYDYEGCPPAPPPPPAPPATPSSPDAGTTTTPDVDGGPMGPLAPANMTPTPPKGGCSVAVGRRR